MLDPTLTVHLTHFGDGTSLRLTAVEMVIATHNLIDIDHHLI